eukprot:1168173-Prorocentrum_minimum.AAC.1
MGELEISSDKMDGLIRSSRSIRGCPCRALAVDPNPSLEARRLIRGSAVRGSPSPSIRTLRSKLGG